MKPRNVKLFIVVIAIIFIASGCASNKITVDLAICGSYGVPGMFCADLKGATYECVVLEEDSQGRIMYTYTTQSVITGKKEQAMVICQKRDKSAVYYYEDVCYLLNEWTNEDLERLKVENDWNQPLHETKMVCQSNKITRDNYIVLDALLEYPQVKQACCDVFGITKQQITELCLLDTDRIKMELYWLTTTRNSEEECYLILVDEDYNCVYQRTERTVQALDQLAEFKLNSGWRSNKTGG